MNALLGRRRDTVSLDGEIHRNRGHVGELSQSALHWSGVVEGSVGFLNHRLAEFHVLDSDDNVLVGYVEFDVSAFIVIEIFVGSDTDVTNDFLHAGEGVLCSWDTVVV